MMKWALWTLGILLYASPMQAGTNGFLEEIYYAAASYHVPFNLLLNLTWVESSWRPTKVNPRDGGSASYGPGQMKLRTARYMGYTGSILGLASARGSRQAAKYLHFLWLKHGRNWRKAVSAYNAGHVTSLNKTYVKKVFQGLENGRI